MGRLVYIDARGRRLEDVARCIERPYSLEPFISRVKPIVDGVAKRGYKAVMEYSRRFDGVAFTDPRVPEEQFDKARDTVDPSIVWALEVAARRIREYQESIMPRRPPAGLRWIPVGSVLAYAPGGLHPYPSSVLMTVIPARVAGVKSVYVASPPLRDNAFMANPLILVAARVAGATSVYAVGGAQAIAGFAYAAQPLPGVDFIAGPGSPYVEAAKLLVSHIVGIDLVAGPSEIAIIALEGAEPQEAALDLLAQAEHGPLSTAVLVTTREDLANHARRLVEERISPENMGIAYIIVVDGAEEAAGLVNMLAPEHVEILGDRADSVVDMIVNAGAVAVNTPVAYTDYAAGPSHVLPTGGAARWRGGLSVYDFLKPVAIVDTVDREALKAAYVLARVEGFHYHAESLRTRLEEG